MRTIAATIDHGNDDLSGEDNLADNVTGVESDHDHCPGGSGSDQSHV